MLGQVFLKEKYWGSLAVALEHVIGGLKVDTTSGTLEQPVAGTEGEEGHQERSS